MLRQVLRAKIHRATITDANLEYEGSLTLDRDLMDAAGMVEFEKVLVLDIDNGSRFETYVIEGERGSRTVALNGAAARLGLPGDRVIVMCFALLDDDEVVGHRPRIIHVDSDNRIVQSTGLSAGD